MILRLGLLLGLLVSLSTCTDSTGSVPSAELFTDRRPGSGIDFRHRRCGSGDKQLVEMNGGGVTVLDYDGDGRLDLFFPQGAALPGFAETGIDLRDRLYRNLGGWRFEDVTDEAGVSEPGYTFSAAAADFDGDGDEDLYLCNYGANVLLQNEGGVFIDVTEKAGLGGERWSSCAAFADFDGDSDLDLYVGNYVIYDVHNPLWCGHEGKGPEWRSYCHPDQFASQHDVFYRNNGDGTFTEGTAAAGLLVDHPGKALGLVTLDFDDDGDVDLYVANDSTPNFLFRNDGDLHFTEVGPEAGEAVNLRGLSEASMGTDVADVDLDGDLDLFVTHLAMETNTLYRNDGDGFFTDRSFESGLGEPSLLWVGFGTRFLDLDHDRDEDVIVVNGHVVDNISLYKSSERFEQPAQVFYNDGRGRFSVAGSATGSYFQEMHVGRALATWDPDDDGDLDLVIVNNDGLPILLENHLLAPGQDAPTFANAEGPCRWIGFRLEGAGANRQAIGARLTVQVGNVRMVREQKGACSYNSWHDPRIHFGLGDATAVDWVEVRWPSGARERHSGLSAGVYHVLREVP